MKKFLVAVPALALVVALSASAVADNGAISQSTLSAMGLGGMQVMSDQDAMQVRGMGVVLQGMPVPPSGHKKPWSLAFGGSAASIRLPGGGGWATTVDGYAAEGKYMAMGSHLSEAGYSISHVEELEVKGLPATKTTKTWSVLIYAGGSASASSL